MAIEALQAAGATGISVDFTLPDLVDTLAEKALPLAADRIEAVRRELDAKAAAVSARRARRLLRAAATGSAAASADSMCSRDQGVGSSCVYSASRREWRRASSVSPTASVASMAAAAKRKWLCPMHPSSSQASPCRKL